MYQLTEICFFSFKNNPLRSAKNKKVFIFLFSEKKLVNLANAFCTDKRQVEAGKEMNFTQFGLNYICTHLSLINLCVGIDKE